MLSADLVHARRQKDRLHVTPLGDRRERALEMASELIGIAESHVGRTREELESAWSSVEAGPRDEKLRDGLRTLIEDALVFETSVGDDAATLRADVFGAAAKARRGGERFDRTALLASLAVARAMTPEALEQGLYADLRGAQRLQPSEHALVPGGARGVVDRYDLAQAQAVLLRATNIVAELGSPSPLALRSLIRKLKFHRLLFTVERRADGHRLALDGPFSLFESTTRYGLALALALPSVLACRPERIEADLRWGKERLPLRFVLERGSALFDAIPESESSAIVTEEVDTLLEKLRAKAKGLDVSVADAILDVPGLGVCVPDLTVVDPKSRARVHVEVLGFWSRAAVWRRVELAERGLAEPIVFCASERLRVSEEVLPETTSASLYTFKGVPSATAVLERVQRLLATR